MPPLPCSRRVPLSAAAAFSVFAVLFAGTFSFALAAEAPLHRLLLVANKGNQSLSVVDPVAGKQIASIPENGTTGHEVIASPDGKLAYVPIYGNSGVGRPGTDGQIIRVIDVAKREIVGSFEYPKGVRPHCPLFHPKNGRLYVTTELENEVSILDPRTLKTVGSIPTGRPESHMLAISHNGHRGYTANVASGTVSVLDLDANKLVTEIKAATRVQRISISPDDRWVITADQTTHRLVVIDTETNTVSGSIPLPGFAYGTAFSPDGRWLVVALPGNSQVGLVDMTERRAIRTLDVPKAPQAVLLQPDGMTAYVSCDSSKQVAVIDVKAWKIEKLIDVGPGADGLAWAVTP